MEIRVDCQYCEPTKTLMRAAPGKLQNANKWLAAWKRSLTAAPGGTPIFSSIDCECGARFSLQDGENGGPPTRKNISPPKILAVAPSNCRFAGGKAVRILGVGLDVGNLVVKFGGTVAEVVNRSATTAVVTAPKGKLSLFVAEGPLARLTISQPNGAFILDEAISLGKSGVGRIRKVDGELLYVTVQSGELAARLNIVGSASGAAASVINHHIPVFQDGELVIGDSTGASGFIFDQRTVVEPTGPFAPNELVIGQTSGAIVKLSPSPAFDSLVSVTVENDYGMRADGSSCLQRCFTYH